ncbi:hypothetical protein GCM10023213_16370 [Prosthecobacter algae]|uniref:Uncharacterized protein n=1 Tax=Prosthecobacter algae TaxID=1144682 RepID=A0ABP9P243_9BACT
MQRSTHLLILTAVTASLASCYGPDPRPFAGNGRSLDQPPRYGDPNRYVEPIAPPPPGQPVGPQVPPPNLDPTAPVVDPGLTVAPPGSQPTVPGGTMTPPAITTPPVITTPSVPPTTPPAGDVPYARAVPGKPGFVYSPKDPKKVISVEGLRPGQKARDPETGDIFRVPY